MARRERGSTRPSGDDRQDAILATAESLLAHRSLGDISIEDLARGAGISRPSFYSYFSSKDEVVIELLARVIDEVEGALAGLPGEVSSDPADRWRKSISAFVDVFTKHEAVAETAIAARLHNPEIQALWARSMQSWVDYTTKVITSERKRGAALDGIPAHDLAVALNLMNERVLSASFSRERPAIDRTVVVDVMLGIWMRSIYGSSAEK
ncbi:TetR/AcrR family transcriptional regulator [Cryobacterium algoritolerans]|uniref:TetR/AcrR family transcriptional regulator n=1 Tax=Cryobacterium algoritolerans TaxID=1259184 RepID=A0A4R8WWK7_9MICO|nr:TetR/AcrR family transcriptional regulator [Cryobacterium algoritolerans]TFC19742.1 TetR/AcrR family transcriptional regulator [Cryobacterium algoritolerans]